MADPFDYKHRDNSYGEFSEEKLIRQARDFVLFCFYLSKNSKSLFFITKSNRLNSVVNDLTSAFKNMSISFQGWSLIYQDDLIPQ